MKKLDAYEYEYEDLQNGVDMELSIFDGCIFLDTQLERFEINSTKLRTDGTPRLIMEYLIDDRPGEIVSIAEIRDDAKIPTNQDLQQMIRKIGFRGYTRATFVPTFKKNELQILTKATLPLAKAQLIMDELEIV